MSREIAQHELRNTSAKIMDAVVAGETFVITRNGEPVAELRPLRTRRRTLVPRADIVEIAGPRVHIDPANFRADLDLVIDQAL